MSDQLDFDQNKVIRQLRDQVDRLVHFAHLQCRPKAELAQPVAVAVHHLPTSNSTTQYDPEKFSTSRRQDCEERRQRNPSAAYRYTGSVYVRPT